MSNPLINQFAQTPVDGEIDLSFMGPVVSARVSANQATALIAGQAVAGDTATPGTAQDGPPPLLALASNAISCIGFIVRNIKDASFPTNARCELALDGAVMYKTALAAITRFAPVEFDTVTGNINPWGGVNPICGYAYDAAINANDLIRIRVSSPQLSGVNNAQTQKVINVTATLAQINAGLVLIPGITGKKITVTNYIARVTGNFATGTSIELEDNSGSPVAVSTIAEAGLTTGAVLLPSSANTTLGAGFGTGLTSAAGLQVVNNGSAQTGGASVQFTITYTQG